MLPKRVDVPMGEASPPIVPSLLRFVLREERGTFIQRSYRTDNMITTIPLERVLGSPLKLRILRTLSRYPSRDFTLRELARAVGASHVGVMKAMEDLLAYDVARERRIGRARAVRANSESALFRAAEALFDREEALQTELREGVRAWCERRPGVLYAALFGSAARGEAGPESDVDLLLVAERPEAVLEDLDVLRTLVRGILGRPLAPLVVTPKEAEGSRVRSLLEAARAGGVVLYRREGRTP